MNTAHIPKLSFALAGEIVSTVPHARRILIESIKTGKDWIIPQAESVLRQLRASTGGAS